MKKNRIFTIILMLILSVTSVSIFSEETESISDRLKLSGFLRIRAWENLSKTQLSDKFLVEDSYNQVYYQDMFFRNRISLKVLPNLTVKTVFDVSAKFGKEGFALGSGDSNLITRNAYFKFKPTSKTEIQAGLMPFSLSGGYILARDASGLHIKHNVFKGTDLYVALIKAYDDADDSFGKNSDPADYSDDNVYYTGVNLSIISGLSSEIYYVYENDQFSDDIDDFRTSRLHWLGIHNKYTSGDLFVKLGGIMNWGNIIESDSNTDVSNKSLLLEFESGYRFDALEISILGEGASGDPRNSTDKNSFQDIKASHSFSRITVDNSGGIAIRGSGESSWYGLCGYGLKLEYPLLNAIQLEMKLLDFRTTKKLEFNNESTSWFGSEINLTAVYIYQDAMKIFSTASVFKPQDAYSAYQGLDESAKGSIFEIMAGVKITY